MRALEVILNGEKVCLAGVNDGVVNAMITLLSVQSGSKREFCTINVVGHGTSPNTGSQWGTQSLSIGDELVIRVIETHSVDKPERVPTAVENWPDKDGDRT